MQDPPGIKILSEDQHVERMARSLYVNHKRRITLIVSWEKLPDATQEFFRRLAEKSIEEIDEWRRLQIAQS